MRVGIMLAALVAMSALVLHLALPMAVVETEADDGTITRDVVTRSEMAAAIDDGRIGGVAGASTGYLLAGSIVLFVGGLGLLVGCLPGPAGRWGLFAGGAFTGLGAAMGLHGNGLWGGRAVSSLIHSLVTGAPTPPYAHREWTALTPGDSFWSIVPVSPLALLGVSFLVLALLGGAWARAMQEEHGIRDMARRHARTALVGAGVLVLTASVPWVVQELPAEDGTSHLYFWSAYDILQKAEAGTQLAQETREAGLIPWEGLAIALRFAMLAGLAGILASWLGIAGRHLEDVGQGVYGRLLENASLANIPAYAYLAVAGFLGAFILEQPNRIQEAVTTGLPLLVTGAAAIGVVQAGLVARRVLATDSDVVADDFPEPVVYD